MVPWDPTNPRGYTNAADMPQADRVAWLRAGRPELAKPTSQSQPKTVAMSVEAQAGWDRWCRGHVSNGLDALAYTIGAEVAKIENRLKAQINVLERALGELRAERTVERAAKIIDLPNPLRRRRDAA
jgi:hypothetical protein